MTKFNKKKDIKKEVEMHPDRIEEGNYEGGVAYDTSDELKLYSQICSCFVNEPKFYGDKNEQNSELISLVRRVGTLNPIYVTKLAVYVRNVMNLRSVSTMLLSELSNISTAKGSSLVRSAVPAVVQRADELAEVMSYQISNYGRTKINNGLKRGLADSFHTFSEYQFAKYDRNGEVKLKDVLRMVRPKPTSKEESDLFKRIKERTLKTPNTWEVVISTKGSTKENWESIMPEMGIFAIVRNLRNFIEKDCDMTPALKLLSNKEAIRKSKMLPFRFYTAYREVEMMNSSFKKSSVLEALSTALEFSIENAPKIQGKTVVAVDLSGSMDDKISEKSTVSRKEIAALFGALACRISDSAIVYGFGDICNEIYIPKNTPIIVATQKIKETKVGCSTNGYLVLRNMIDSKLIADRLLVFSDMQLYGESSYDESFSGLYIEYRRKINQKIKLYSFDLAGYGHSIVPESNAYLLSGFSDRVLDFLVAVEEPMDVAVKKIKDIDINQYRRTKHADRTREGMEREAN